jgi:starvation-inducible DNA-binding protein
MALRQRKPAHHLVAKETDMHTTRNDLPEKARRRIAELLSARLADAIDLKLQVKHAHWNVKGPQFIALHGLFDQLASDLDSPADDMAERITALGGTPDGTLAGIARHTSLDAYPAELNAGSEHLEALENAFAGFGKRVRKAIGEADKLGDEGTADLFTGISRQADKQLWLLEAHLQAER